MLAESGAVRRRGGHYDAGALARPEISVVVPSHARRLRLWWLLNALDEQTAAPERFEVIVVHDYGEADRGLLERHPLVRSGTARLIAIEPGTGSPAKQRNIGWREARAQLIAFTDDDCRPDPRWVEELLAAAGSDDLILQGKTRPDPLEIQIMSAPHHRSLHVDPPNLFAQTCNIAYPRPLLEALGGFDEQIPSAAGEDTDLALRAREIGGRQVGLTDAVVYHAVEETDVLGAIRGTRKWEHLPLLVRKHPDYRRHMILRIFWRETHAEYYAAAAGIALSRKNPLALVLAAPYVRRAMNRRGSSRRGRLASAIELPGRVAVDTAEVVTMIRGSIRYRTPML